MRHLVTGGSGFIGTNLIEELRANGDEILNLDIAAPNIESHVTNWRRLDILDKPALCKAVAEFRPTHLTHLAARTDTDGTKLADYLVNTDGTQNVLAAIAATPSIERVIITSSQFVNQYSGEPKHDLDFAPHTIYGESKVVTERLTRAAVLSCTWTIVRPTNIWGPWHRRYPREFWRILGRGLYVHPGAGSVVRAYGYVRNVTHQIRGIFAAPAPLMNGRVFYLGDEPIDLLDWVNGFSRAQRGRPVRIVPARIVRAIARCGDLLGRIGIGFPLTTTRYRSMTTSNSVSMSRTFEALGDPPYSLADGIAQTVGWLATHHPDLVQVRA